MYNISNASDVSKFTAEETTEKICEIAYEANRAFCMQNGDEHRLPWIFATKVEQQSMREVVNLCLKGQLISANQIHDAWVLSYFKAGWKFGPIRDYDKKVHPSLVPYDRLSVFEKTKLELCFSIIKALSQNYYSLEGK